MATTVTDANGNYVVYDVPFGTYAVTETNIASFPFDVSDNDGGDFLLAITRLVGRVPILWISALGWFSCRPL